MSTTSRDTTFIGDDGMPVINDVDTDLWGRGTVAQRPVSGSAVGDIYFVIDVALQIFRMEVWDGTAWAPIQGSPTLVDRVIARDITIPPQHSMISHDIEISDGNCIVIEDDGELLLL